MDSAVVQDANYEFDNFDRAYIDSQALGAQLHLTQSLINGVICTWVLLDGSSAAVNPGDVVCLNGTSAATVTKALPTPLAGAGNAFGIVMAGAPPGALVRVAIKGLLTPQITGLPTSGNAAYAYVNASARVATAAAPASGTFLGTVDAAGNLTLALGPAFGFVDANGAIELSPNATILGAGTLASVSSGTYALTTTDASAHTIFTFAHPANTNTDWSVTVVGRDTANNGHYYRADIVFGYSRASGVSSGSLVSSSGSTTPTNVVNAQSWGGASVTTSGNNVLIQVTGAAATTIDWSLIAQIQVVS